MISPNDRPLRVCINARLTSSAGGVQQVIIGLAGGLSQLTDGDEEYYFLVYPDASEWIRPYIGGPCRLLFGARSPGQRNGISRLKTRVKRSIPALHHIRRKLPWPVSGSLPPIQLADQIISESGIDVVHFPFPDAFETTLPNIYHPWDLQHLHLPHFFTPRDWQLRERNYRWFCNQASLVSVASQWVKRDLIEHYELPPEKISVVPMAPVTALYPRPTEEDLETVRRKFALPLRFAFYPAQTWPHKNHLNLLKAVQHLAQEANLDIHLVCSGTRSGIFPRIQEEVHRLDIANRVHFLGFVSPLELQSLYRLSQMMVFPSKFEGWGLPLTEAFHAGVPVACSNVTCLPEQALDAALLFDPDDHFQIAEAMERLWTSELIRRELVQKGHRYAARLNWDITARTFRAQYRLLAGREVSPRDEALLSHS